MAPAFRISYIINANKHSHNKFSSILQPASMMDKHWKESVLKKQALISQELKQRQLISKYTPHRAQQPPLKILNTTRNRSNHSNSPRGQGSNASKSKLTGRASELKLSQFKRQNDSQLQLQMNNTPRATQRMSGQKTSRSQMDQNQFLLRMDSVVEKSPLVQGRRTSMMMFDSMAVRQLRLEFYKFKETIMKELHRQDMELQKHVQTILTLLKATSQNQMNQTNQNKPQFYSDQTTKERMQTQPIHEHRQSIKQNACESKEDLQQIPNIQLVPVSHLEIETPQKQPQDADKTLKASKSLQLFNLNLKNRDKTSPSMEKIKKCSIISNKGSIIINEGNTTHRNPKIQPNRINLIGGNSNNNSTSIITDLNQSNEKTRYGHPSIDIRSMRSPDMKGRFNKFFQLMDQLKSDISIGL